MAGTRRDGHPGIDRDDVLVRRRNGERCVLSSLTGTRAVLIIGETLEDLGDSFGPPAGDGCHPALVVGIHRLGPEEHAFSEVVFDDARITLQLLESPSIPVAYLVRGVTPLGPAAVGPAEIESLLQRLGATRPRRGTGAIDLGDLTT